LPAAALYLAARSSDARFRRVTSTPYRVVGVVPSSRRSLQRLARLIAHFPSDRGPLSSPGCRLPLANDRGQIGSPPLMRLRLFPSAFAGCAVPPGISTFQAIPLRRCSGLSTQAIGRLAHAVFSASRLRGVRCVFWRRRPSKSFVTVFLGSRVPDSQDRAVIAAWPGFFGPGDAHGILHPSQCCSDSRVTASFDASLPPAVSPLARREFHRRGVRQFGGLLGLRLRLLGFGPANQPCRVIRRSRHGFYAQGRSDSLAVTALGF
jgi:hypothetical protein